MEILKRTVLLLMMLSIAACSNDDQSKAAHTASLKTNVDNISRAEFVKLDSETRKQLYSVMHPDTKANLWKDKFEKHLSNDLSFDEVKYVELLLELINDGFFHDKSKRENTLLAIPEIMYSYRNKCNWSDLYMVHLTESLEDQTAIKKYKSII